MHASFLNNASYFLYLTMLWYLGAWQIMGATAPTPPLKGSWFLEIVEGATSMPLIRTSSSPEFTALTGTLSLCLKPPHGQAPNTERPPAAYWNVSELTKFVWLACSFPQETPTSPSLLLPPDLSWHPPMCARGPMSSPESRKEGTLLSNTAASVSVITPFPD